MVNLKGKHEEDLALLLLHRNIKGDGRDSELKDTRDNHRGLLDASEARYRAALQAHEDGIQELQDAHKDAMVNLKGKLEEDLALLLLHRNIKGDGRDSELKDTRGNHRGLLDASEARYRAALQ